MSMTKEEAIKQIEKLKSYCEYMADSDESGAYLFDLDGQALDLALSALRPVSREQVEMVWGGEWEEERFAGDHEGWQHRECGRHSTEKAKWCPKCGKAMTDEAVGMVMERLEALRDE